SIRAEATLLRVPVTVDAEQPVAGLRVGGHHVRALEVDPAQVHPGAGPVRDPPGHVGKGQVQLPQAAHTTDAIDIALDLGLPQGQDPRRRDTYVAHIAADAGAVE